MISVGMRFSNRIKWIFVIPLLMSDLFSVFPFGLYSLSLILGVGVAEKFIMHIFTDRSILPVLTSSLAGMVIFRLAFSVLLGLRGVYLGESMYLFATRNLHLYLLEIMGTAIVTTLLFILVRAITKIIAPNYFIIYEK